MTPRWVAAPQQKKKIPFYLTFFLPVVLYECETWCHTLREQHGLRVFGNRVLRTGFRPKWALVAVRRGK